MIDGTLGVSEARRIALVAHGLTTARRETVSDRASVRRVIERQHLLQIDSVNVLVRAHEMPLWSRLGPYRRDALPRLLADGEVFEYWAHEASLVPASDWPLFAARRAAARDRMWPGVRALGERDPSYVRRVLDQVRTAGALAASDIEEGKRRSGPWWDWHDSKLALEWLFWCGEVTARRRPNFEREYVLPETQIPAEHLHAPAIEDHAARLEMLDRAGRALGVGTSADLCDYYRLKPSQSRAALRELVDRERLVPVRVEGWRDAAFLHCEARRPRSMPRTAMLVSPFDPVVWHRPRAERLFGFHYRIEIYTPAAKRVHGYYVLPFLLDDRPAARLDLKADRHEAVLRVQAAHLETHADRRRTIEALVPELLALARWLELGSVEVAERGDLARPLRRALASAP